MKKVRTIRIDKEVSDNLDAICNRHGDVSWHIEQALNGYKPIKTMLGVKPKKIKAIDQSAIDSAFDYVWELYGKKGNHKMSKARYSKLSAAIQNKIIDHIPDYVLSTPEKKFRKDFQSYLNLEAWNDEVIQNETHQQPNQPRRSSAVDRAQSAADERKRRREIEFRERHGSLVDGANENVRASASEPIRGNDTGDLGAVVEGNFTRTD